MNFLINTNKPKYFSNPPEELNLKYTELATSSSYVIPAVWFMFFNHSDLINTEIEYMNDDNSTSSSHAKFPCVSVVDAIKNIENSFEFFTSAFNSKEIATKYLEETIKAFNHLEHEYLMIDASEYLILNLENDEWHTFETCFLRNNEAIKAIHIFSGYDDNIVPYDYNEFYSDPYIDNQEKIDNSIALNHGFSNIESRISFPVSHKQEAIKKQITSNKPVCSNCDESVKFMDIFIAGLPSLIKCRSCKSTIKFQLNPIIDYPILFILSIFMCVLGWFTANYIEAAEVVSFKYKHLLFGSIIVYAVIFEVLFTFWLLKFKTIVK